MKKILIFILAISAMQVSAQEKLNEVKRDRVQKIEDFTPEEAATIKTKKMTLALDLTETQQKEIYKLNLEEAKERKEMVDARRKMREEGKGKEIADEKHFERMNNQLDKQIELKQKMKNILNEEQYKKWVEGLEKRRQNSLHKKRRMTPKH
jgi:predicted lipase